MSRQVFVYSQKDFDSYIKSKNLDENNIEDDTTEAFISIIGTPECNSFYLEEPDAAHIIERDHNNWINLEFDDISRDLVWKGHKFKAITQEQADKIFNFIESNVGKDFIIHCRAGHSRSFAVGKFLVNFYRYTLKTPDWNTPNSAVYGNLSHAYYQKYKPFLNDQSEGTEK